MIQLFWVIDLLNKRRLDSIVILYYDQYTIIFTRVLAIATVTKSNIREAIHPLGTVDNQKHTSRWSVQFLRTWVCVRGDGSSITEVTGVNLIYVYENCPKIFTWYQKLCDMLSSKLPHVGWLFWFPFPKIILLLRRIWHWFYIWKIWKCF